MRFDTFNGDFEELARLIDSVWGGHFGTKTHFRYPPDWLAGFFDGSGTNRDLLIEHRDETGAITGFIGAVPRRYHVHGQEVRLGLVTLLTSSPRNVGFVGLEIERELFKRGADAGLFGTYHFCLDGQRTPDLLRWAAKSRKTKAIEVAPVSSLLRAAKASPDGADEGAVRPVATDDVRSWRTSSRRRGERCRSAGSSRRRSFRRSSTRRPPSGPSCCYVDGRPIGVCVYARRQLVGTEVFEVANVDLLIAPDSTPDEARRFGRAIASDAAAHGARYVIAPQRVASVFPHAREAGLRLPCAPSASSSSRAGRSRPWRP